MRPRLAFLAYRHQLPDVLAALGLTGTGVEVGVHRGVYSETLLAGSSLSQLILVDPWLEQDDYEDILNVSQAQQESVFEDAQRRLARFDARAVFWRTTSLEAAERVADASLDFVYLDARHDHASVAADLRAWWPKVKPAGVFAGHDYLDGDLPQGRYGVRSAVDEFFAPLDVAVYETYGDSSWPTWIAAPRSRFPHLMMATRAVVRFDCRVRRRLAFVRQHRRWR